MNILLVEDQDDSRKTLSRLIGMRGHKVTQVATAEEAERVLAADSFPFLILDWMLPGKSGIDLCRELRARQDGDEMFILLVTGKTDRADLEMALEVGANDYLTKPIDLSLLNVRLAVAERQIRDLTERNQARVDLQQSARTLTDILENTTDGFFALDHAWRFTYVNPQAERLFGRARKELLGGELWQKFPELRNTPFEENYRQVMANQTPVEFEACEPNGTPRWFEVHAYPSGGGVSAFFRDVTERKRAEDDRLTKGKIESLGTLAGGIAHDLNNILTVISGNIGLAQLEAPVEEKSLLGCLAKASQAAQEAAHMSSQLLTFSKGGSPVKKVVRMPELLAKSAHFSLHGSNLRAEMVIPPDLWPTEVDSTQIEQVINALMINAREAMPSGGTVDISASNVKLDDKPGALLPGGRYIKVAITDHGGGVPADMATKIFDPYFTTKPVSSGLGLSISFSIVKKHGGMLHLEQSSPAGAVFAFFLPAAKAEPAVVRNIPNSGLPCSLQRILVMDDEEGIRELTSQLLNTLGYEVTAVTDGVEAVNTYERAMRRGENFQAVILDATIRGGMGGLATISRLRNIDPSVVAIICSGYSDEAALAEFLQYGFRGALPKPFTRRDLADVLQRAVTSSKTEPAFVR